MVRQDRFKRYPLCLEARDLIGLNRDVEVNQDRLAGEGLHHRKPLLRWHHHRLKVLATEEHNESVRVEPYERRSEPGVNILNVIEPHFKESVTIDVRFDRLLDFSPCRLNDREAILVVDSWRIHTAVERTDKAALEN